MTSPKRFFMLTAGLILLGCISIASAEGLWKIRTIRSQPSDTQQPASVTRSRDDYLRHVVKYQQDGYLIRFRAHQMPIKVYITKPLSVPGWTARHNDQIRAAMQEWNTHAGDVVSFQETNDMNKADLIVYWRYSIYHSSGDKMEVWGYADHGKVIDNVRGKSAILMATHNFDDYQPVPLNEVKGIGMHEFGHALGLCGHSPDPNDLMHPTCEKTCEEGRFSARDLNTLRRLYSLDETAQSDP